jgi:hypothetical protein
MHDVRLTPVRRSFALLALTIALIALWSVAGSAYAGGSSAPSRGKTHSEQARTAGVESLNEVMHLSITSAKGQRIAAQGTATGTIAGSFDFKLFLSSASRASAEFSGSNSHGTVHGSGTASYRVSGAVSYYTGTVSSITGTGRYAHAQSEGLQFSGTLNRRSFEVTIRVQGKWRA